MMWLRCAVAVAVAAAATYSDATKSIPCYDSFWVEDLRVATRLVRWSAQKMDLATWLNTEYRYNYGGYDHPLKDCQVDINIHAKDPVAFKLAIDDCLCVKLRVTLVEGVFTMFQGELNALPATESVDAFYLHHARAQVRTWRRAVAMEGDKALVAYYDSLADQCFTQPHLANVENHAITADKPKPTLAVPGATKTPPDSHAPPPPTTTTWTETPLPSATKSPVTPTPPRPPQTTPTAVVPTLSTSTPRFDAPPPVTTTTIVTRSTIEPSPTVESAGIFSSPVVSAGLAVLGGIVGAIVVILYQSMLGLIRDPPDDSPEDRSGYVAITSPRARSRVRSQGSLTDDDDEEEEEDDDDAADRPLLRHDAHETRVQRSVDATE